MFGCIVHTGANNIFNNIDGLIYIKITLNILKPLLIPFVLGFFQDCLKLILINFSGLNIHRLIKMSQLIILLNGILNKRLLLFVGIYSKQVFFTNILAKPAGVILIVLNDWLFARDRSPS